MWVFIFGVFWLQYMGAMNVAGAFLLAACVILTAYPFTTYLSKHLLKKAMEQKNMLRFILQFFFISLLYSVLIPLILILFNHLEQVGVLPVSEFADTRNGILYAFLNAFLISLIINLSFCGLRFFEQNIKLQQELADSRFQILQAQINPHFMFNVLNHVHVLIKKEPELADVLLLQYTDILRYQLYSGKKERITIEQEVEFLKTFIEVEMIRWKNKLNINCNWDIETPNMEFPPLLLITFIENAFKHVSRSNTEKGCVNISFKQEGQTIQLDVENSNSNSTFPKKEDSGIGLINIKRRLDILFPNKHTLKTTNNDVFYSTKLTINI
jgi:Putative regulator of cell autolysis